MNDRELYTAAQLREKATDQLTQSSSRATDFNPGSVVRAVLDSVVFFVNFLQVRIKKAYRRFLFSTAEGTDLDERAADWQLTRVSAAAATTTIVFMRDDAATEDFTIAAGSQVSTEPDTLGSTIDFTLDEELTFASGATTASGTVTCTQTGDVGNVDANTITNITSSIPGVDSITNPNAVTDGSDDETDQQFRARIPRHILGLKKATKTALEAAAFGVQGIVFVNVKANTPDNGTNTIYVTTAIGDVSTELKTEVKEAVDEVTAFGIVNVIAVPDIDYVTLEMDILFDDDNYTTGVVQDEILEKVADYVSINPESYLYVSDIIDLVKEIPGVINVKNVLIDGVADDYEVNDTTVIRLENGEDDITINILN